MRTRYYVRIGRVQRAIGKVSTECYREWITDRIPPYTDFRNRWLLKHYNILITRQANGVEKVGFGSRGAMVMFVLRFG